MRVNQKRRYVWCTFILVLLGLSVFVLHEHDFSSKTPWDNLRGKKFSSLVAPTENTILMRPRGPFLPYPRAVIYVMSLPTPESCEMRKAIRATWAKNKTSHNVEVLFFIGTTNNSAFQESILKENELLGDIVLDNMTESYFNLPIKVLRMMKHYVSVYDFYVKTSENSRLPLFIKCDENVFVNLENFFTELTRLLNQLQSRWRSVPRGFIAGKVFNSRSLRPIRHKRNKRFYMPHDVYPWPWYPRYISGPFYAIEGHLVARIYKLALQHSYFPFEDTFITGIIGNQQMESRFVHIWNIITSYPAGKRTLSELQYAAAIHHVENPQVMMEIYEKTLNVNSSKPL